MSDSQEPISFLAPEPADLAPFFPGYEIEHLIATGGMGAVYSAVQKSLDRQVALKILPTELSQDAAFCKSFREEAKAMAKLNHPNLIGVYDSGEVNGMLYLIMELVPGQSVYHAAYGSAIDPAEVIRLISAICHGLSHAHEHGIIHRDIKPANILLDLHAQPKIGDFGLASAIDRHVEDGEEIFGTPHYTAPEVVNAPKTVNHRADIFSVGVMLHELLTAKLPADDPRPASTIVHCDTRFDHIIRRATQPDPAARYANVKDIAKDLQTIAASLASETGVKSTAAPKAKQATAVAKPKKSPVSPILTFALIAALAAAAYQFLYLKKPLPSFIQSLISKETPPAATPSAPTIAPVVIPPTTPQAPPPEPPPEMPAPTPQAPPEAPAAPQPAPTPEPAAVIQPKADVPAFFTRARKAMAEKSKSFTLSHKSNLKTNFTAFAEALKAVARKEKVSGQRIDAEVAADIATWAAAGNRIPDDLGIHSGSLPSGTATARPFLDKQTSLDAALDQQLEALSAQYISGLEIYIQRYNKENDPGAAALLEEEIKATKADPKYFPSLLDSLK